MTTPSEQLYREIPLTKSQVALIDAADYERLIQWRWCASWSKDNRQFYALRKSQGRNIWMHREILGLVRGDGKEADHKNRNTLDNRRENLRIATRSQNQCNKLTKVQSKSGYRGVRAKGSSYEARITVQRRAVYLGMKATPQEAYALYCDAAKRLHGEFAYDRISEVGSTSLS